jgi:hypothetical protein
MDEKILIAIFTTVLGAISALAISIVKALHARVDKLERQVDELTLEIAIGRARREALEEITGDHDVPPPNWRKKK